MCSFHFIASFIVFVVNEQNVLKMNRNSLLVYRVCMCAHARVHGNALIANRNTIFRASDYRVFTFVVTAYQKPLDFFLFVCE